MNYCDIFTERAELELDLGKLGKLNVTYDPQFYTPSIEARIQQEATANRVGWLAETLDALLVEWDFCASTARDARRFGVAVGEPVPLTEECLVKLPAVFLAAVFNAFIEAATAKNARSSETSASS